MLPIGRGREALLQLLLQLQLLSEADFLELFLKERGKVLRDPEKLATLICPMLLEVYLNYETSCLLSVGKLVGRSSVIISKKQESGIYTSMLPSEHLLESIFSIYIH